MILAKTGLCKLRTLHSLLFPKMKIHFNSIKFEEFEDINPLVGK